MFSLCLFLPFLNVDDGGAFVLARHVSRYPRRVVAKSKHMNLKTSSPSTSLHLLPTISTHKDVDVSSSKIASNSPAESQFFQNNRKEDVEQTNILMQSESRSLAQQKRDSFLVNVSGVAFTCAFILSLAVFDATMQRGQLSGFQGLVVTMAKDVNEVFDSVKEAVLPGSASDVVSIMLGEGIAGAFGGAVDFITTSFITSKILSSATSEMSSQGTSVNSRLGDEGQLASRPSVTEAVTEAAVAGGDYFMTRAAAIPLLSALGLPPYAATFVSVLIAAVPYEIIKLAYQRKLELDDEEVIMDRMLEEQQQSPWRLFSLADRPKQVDPTQLEPATEEGIDFVDVFADVVKWLVYDVMQTLFGGSMSCYGKTLDPALESACFGMVAGFSSQLYAEISYNVIGFGSLNKHHHAKTKTVPDHLTTLCLSCLSGAVLFGVYQTVSDGIAANTISPCADASDFDMCLGHYVVSSLTGTSTWDAKGRALVTAVVSALVQLQHVLGR